MAMTVCIVDFDGVRHEATFDPSVSPCPAYRARVERRQERLQVLASTDDKSPDFVMDRKAKIRVLMDLSIELKIPIKIRDAPYGNDG